MSLSEWFNQFHTRLQMGSFRFYWDFLMALIKFVCQNPMMVARPGAMQNLPNCPIQTRVVADTILFVLNKGWCVCYVAKIAFKKYINRNNLFFHDVLNASCRNLPNDIGTMFLLFLYSHFGAQAITSGTVSFFVFIYICKEIFL